MRRALAFLVVTALAACGGGGSGGGDPIELTVFAGSSLTAAFTDAIGPDFEDQHDGATIVFNFGASDSLAGQIQSEGSTDVFASASGTWMDAVEEDPGVSDRTDFVQNRLVIITPPDNPAGIASIDDLATSGLQLVLAKSFSRIHGQNLPNSGILPLTFEDAADYDEIAQGDVLLVRDLRRAVQAGNRIELERLL